MNYAEKTAELRALEKGWDGDDAEPPHDPAIALAVLIALGVEKSHRPPDRLEASVVRGGGVGLTWHGESAEVYVEALNRGGAVMLVGGDDKGEGDVIDMRHRQGFEMVEMVAAEVGKL